MKNIKYLVVLLCMTFVSVSSFAQEKELQTESDGFQWYQLYQNGKYGAQSLGGVTFIPLSRGYTFIYYVPFGGWFIVNNNKGERFQGRGCCDITGREIVAPGRYDHVEITREQEYRCCIVDLNAKYGICDMDGREIIAPRYEALKVFNGYVKYKDKSGKWVSTGIKVSSLAQTTTSTTTTQTTKQETVTPTPQPQPQPQPQPVRQPQPMQVFQPCGMCQGSGKCHVCLGDGHPLMNPTGSCFACNGTGRCAHCAGRGGQNVIEYR
ncbi:MAG: WG repeat-containing protein [Bacteroidales bacterium]|nr:WG repeat-containing protein [Bacteroidales bacterium]